MKKINLALAFAALFCAAGATAKDATPEEVRKEAREIFQKVISFRTSEGLGQVPAMARPVNQAPLPPRMTVTKTKIKNEPSS